MANMNMDTVLTFEEVQADLKSYLRQSQIDINDVIDAQNIYRQIYEEISEISRVKLFQQQQIILPDKIKENYADILQSEQNDI